MYRRLITLALAASVLGGCGSITGFSDASSKFACKAPRGTVCTSVSGVYANSQAEHVQGQQPARPPLASVQIPSGGAAFPVAAAGMPIRSQARMLRIWVAPWRDEDDTLHDQSYMYVMIDPGKWLIERSREATVQKTMTRLRPLGQPRTAAASGAGNGGAGGESGGSGGIANVRSDSAAQASAREAAVVPGESGEAP